MVTRIDPDQAATGVQYLVDEETAEHLYEVLGDPAQEIYVSSEAAQRLENVDVGAVILQHDPSP